MNYFDHNERRGKRPAPKPDVLPAAFDPPTFSVSGGIVVEESNYYECGEGYAHKVGTECRGQCVLRG